MSLKRSYKSFWVWHRQLEISKHHSYLSQQGQATPHRNHVFRSNIKGGKYFRFPGSCLTHDGRTNPMRNNPYLNAYRFLCTIAEDGHITPQLPVPCNECNIVHRTDEQRLSTGSRQLRYHTKLHIGHGHSWAREYQGTIWVQQITIQKLHKHECSTCRTMVEPPPIVH